jgi:N-acyl amino acid synthase of PEP-CTERM/exosortase system
MRHQPRVVQEFQAPPSTERPSPPKTVIASAELVAASVIDDDPLLLRQSYALRYQVYCLERRFLSAEAYPDGLESDSFDAASVHIGVVDACGQVLATARLVSVAAPATDFPLLRYCRLFPGQTVLHDPLNRIVEVSRLAIARRHPGCPHRGAVKRRDARRHVFEALLKGIYQASKRLQATHWVAATERSLQRRVKRYGFPFRAIGPESDYSGAVVPYLMSLAEFDAVILSGRLPVLDDFLVGLEPRFQPNQMPESYASHISLVAPLAGHSSGSQR